jgi:hypothetical protein
VKQYAIFLLCILGGASPLSSIATESNIRQTAGEAVKPLEKTKKNRRLKNWVMMPVPISNPTIGTGLALGAMRLYKLDEEAPASTLTIGGMWADSKSWAGGAYTRNYLKQDRLRINGGAGYADVNLKFCV